MIIYIDDIPGGQKRYLHIIFTKSVQKKLNNNKKKAQKLLHHFLCTGHTHATFVAEQLWHAAHAASFLVLNT